MLVYTEAGQHGHRLGPAQGVLRAEPAVISLDVGVVLPGVQIGRLRRLLRLLAIGLRIERQQLRVFRHQPVAEVRLPRDLGQGVVEGQLSLDGCRAVPGALGIAVAGQIVGHSYVKGNTCTLYRIRPPAGHRGVVHALVADVPVDLGADVVDPPLLDPFPAVGVGVVVALIAAGGIGALGQAALIRPHAGGADAVGQPRINGVDALPQCLDQLVDIVPAPVADVGKALAVLGIGGPVGKAAAGVEVVVQVNAVDVILAGQLLRPPHDVLPHLGQAGIEVVVALILHHPVGVELCGVVGGQGLELRRAPLGDAEGIDPGVELQPQGVGPLHPVGQRIKSVFRGGPLCAGEVFAPRVQLGGIEGVGGGPHLENHGVHAHVHTAL